LGEAEYVSAFLMDPVDPDLAFDNFIRCKGNAFALDLAQTVATKPPIKLPYNPLYLYGDVGLGKTHLLSAIANKSKDKSVLLVNTSDLEAEFEKAKAHQSRAELRQWLVAADILLVDDIQLCEEREELQRDVFSILNHMTRARRWVVISSDVPPNHLAGIESRLLSRLSGGVIVSLQMGDRNEQNDFVRRLVGDRDIETDVVEYMADNFGDNFRQLKSAVTQLTTRADWDGSPLSMELAFSVAESLGLAPAPESTDVPEVTEAPQEEPVEAPSPAPTEIEEEAVEEVPEEAPAEAADAGPPEPEAPPAEIAAPDGPGTAEAKRFKEMLAGAQSEEEQALALQIALGERIRQLRKEGGDPNAIQRLEHALELVRAGKMGEAVRSLGS
ncbi:DnaA ATPase domain-containing protein, partial [Thermodesulfobacteriota bacterium]